MKFDILVLLENLSKIFEVNYNMTRITGYLHEDMCICMIISLRILLRLRNVVQKYVEKHERNYIYIYILIYISENFC